MKKKSMLVKICGLSNAIDAAWAVQYGADALGFVMGGKILPVEVEPPAQTVRKIIKTLPKTVDSFLVTHLTNPDDIVSLADYVSATGIQISEDVGIEIAKKVRSLTKKKIIKTVVVKDGALEKMKNYEPYCDYILLDSCVAGYTGGTGATNDWILCAKLIAAAKKPVYLAGGLTPENVTQAMKKTHPQGVDVSTGISAYSSTYLRKDRKDERKIKKFIELAKKFEV